MHSTIIKQISNSCKCAPIPDVPFMKLRYWYTNADSVTKKIDKLKGRVNLFSPDIICITEIFPKNCLYGISKVELHIEGYDCFCSEFNHHNRGVCIMNHGSGS